MPRIPPEQSPVSYVVLHFSPALPCAHPMAQRPDGICGQPATTGIATQAGGGAWEIIPTCAGHLQDLLDLYSRQKPLNSRTK